MVTQSSPFGSNTRTRSLIALRLLGECHARELARIMAAPLTGVQRALQSLERDGLVSGRSMGRMRIFTLNPRYFAVEDLRRFLLRLAEAEPELSEAVERVRRRPRSTGKPI